jgi:hypothetical protein
VSTPTLTEAETLRRARLDILNEAGRLTDRNQRLQWKALKAGGSPIPPSSLTLGGQVVTDSRFKRLAAKQLTAPPDGQLKLDDDVPLANLSGWATKTLLRAGSATSVGAFQSLAPGRTYEPVRRPLELLDLVRLGTTTEAAIPYMRQTTYTPGRSRGGRGDVHHDRHEARGNAAVRAGDQPGGVDRVLGARHDTGAGRRARDERHRRRTAPIRRPPPPRGSGAGR